MSIYSNIIVQCEYLIYSVSFIEIILIEYFNEPWTYLLNRWWFDLISLGLSSLIRLHFIWIILSLIFFSLFNDIQRNMINARHVKILHILYRVNKSFSPMTYSIAKKNSNLKKKRMIATRSSVTGAILQKLHATSHAT